MNNFETREMDIDELIGNLNEPKLEYDRPSFDDVKIPNDNQVRQENIERAEELSRETAQEVGREFANLTINAVTGICSFVGQEPAKKYEIPASQKKDLSEAYARVAERYNMQATNPIVTAVILTIVVFSVPIRTALQDRKLKKIEAEQKRQADELQRMQERQAEFEAKLKAEKQNETNENKPEKPQNE